MFIPRFVTALLYKYICIQPKKQSMVIIRMYLWLTLVSVNIHYTGYIYKVIENPMQYAQLIQHIRGTLECSKQTFMHTIMLMNTKFTARIRISKL